MRVFFEIPQNGAEVKSPFLVRMRVEGFGVAPAGTMVPGTGHHHILVDSGPIKSGEVIPADEKHIHFGKGQTEAQISLPPGKHRLTLQFADGAHRSYGETLAQTIEVLVK